MKLAHLFKLTNSFRLQVGAFFKFKLAVFLKSAHLFKEGAQYDSAHIFQVQVNPLFRVSVLFQGGVGRAICKEGVLFEVGIFGTQIFVRMNTIFTHSCPCPSWSLWVCPLNFEIFEPWQDHWFAAGVHFHCVMRPEL